MLQVAILDLVFSPYALGLVIAPLLAPLCALALFSAQAVASRWWLERFEFGPLEWVWRSITYWKAPFRGFGIREAPQVSLPR